MSKDSETSVRYNWSNAICRQANADHARNCVIPRARAGAPTGTWKCVPIGGDTDIGARRVCSLQKGRMTPGLPTFRTPWSRMPRNGCLARIAGLRGVRPVVPAHCDVALTPTIAPSPVAQAETSVCG